MDKEQSGDGKIPLILLSGGLDSTAALLQALTRTDVDVVYIAGRQGPHKINAELQAIEDILEAVSGIAFAHKVRHFYRFKMELDSFVDDRVHDYVVGQRFSQPPQWIYGMTAVARPDKHSEIVLSYITGDQMLSHLIDLQWMWDHLCTIVFGPGNKIPLNFPWRYHKKRELINDTPIGILSKVWTCEIPSWLDNEQNNRSCRFEGIEHAVIPSLKQMKSDRSYKYMACGHCAACLAQKESYITSSYVTHENMLKQASLSTVAPIGETKVETIIQEA